MTLDIFLVFLLGLLFLLYCFYWYLTKDFDYWKKRNVPFMKPIAIFGNVKEQILQRSTWISFVDRFYADFKTHGFGGVFFVRTPSFWVCDPRLVEQILVKDFKHFHDRWTKPMFSDNPESNTLFFSEGERWRSMRLKLAPAFASGKVKGMFQQILSSSDNVVRRLNDHSDGIDVENMTSDFATEVLASCLCGVKMSNSKEATEINRAIYVFYKPTLRKNIIHILYNIFPPKLLRCIGIKAASQEAVDIFTSVIKGILNYRKNNGERRNDILQTMLDMREEEESRGWVEDGKESCNLATRFIKNTLGKETTGRLFTEETIAAQIMGFMRGGIKPISVTITFALFEVAKNPLIQNKLQNEIDSVMLKPKKWNIESLKGLTYLDQVIQETLRMYNTNVLLMRMVSEEYHVAGTNVILEKDMQVFIPADCLHKDADLYPCPLEFRPERWQGNNFRTSSTYLPFGHGPRICISIRLAVLTIKLCLARVLAQHRVRVSSRMALPLQFEDDTFKAKGGVWLNFTDRNS